MIRHLSACVALALLGISCGTPSLAAAVRVDLHEFAIASDAQTWAAGTVDVTVANSGEFPHTLVVTSMDGAVVGAIDVIAAGDVADVRFDVDAGEYLLTCRIVVEVDDGVLVDHFERGMVERVTVVG